MVNVRVMAQDMARGGLELDFNLEREFERDSGLRYDNM